ncbi:hypothetical protein BGX28_001505, partial [Mortierella sp. GBA30]
MQQLAQAQALEEVPSPALRQALQSTLYSFTSDEAGNFVEDVMNVEYEEHTEAQEDESPNGGVPIELLHSHAKVID